MKVKPLAFLFSLLCFLTQGCSDGCKNTVIQTAVSPDGTLAATVFTRDCGATTSQTVQVYLGGKVEAVPDVGNVFRGTHSGKATVQWQGDKKLASITDAETFLLMKEYEGVSIELLQAVIGQQALSLVRFRVFWAL